MPFFNSVIEWSSLLKSQMNHIGIITLTNRSLQRKVPDLVKISRRIVTSDYLFFIGTSFKIIM